MGALRDIKKRLIRVKAAVVVFMGSRPVQMNPKLSNFWAKV
jgi:hypothetical protein